MESWVCGKLNKFPPLMGKVASSLMMSQQVDDGERHVCRYKSEALKQQSSRILNIIQF